jgi:hypothetical protein
MKQETEVFEKGNENTGSELPLAHQNELGDGDLSEPKKGADGQTAAEKSSQPEVVRAPNGKPRRKRKDKGGLHACRHGVLSMHLLTALSDVGENPKNMRRLERKFRAALQPAGELGALLFDRWWSCYLRLVLVARLEARAVATRTPGEGRTTPVPVLAPGKVPTLVLPSGPNGAGDSKGAEGGLSPEIFRQLALVQRYDRHFSREMYRALALLLIMKKDGEVGLEHWVRSTLAPMKIDSKKEGEVND